MPNERGGPPIRAAATIVMLRDGTAGLEVFLVKRHAMSEVHGGAYVFPGGKVDLADSELDFAAHLDATPAQLHAALHESDLSEEEATVMYVAALREAFEETGTLFARGADAAVADMATELLREGRGFEEVLAMMRLRLEASCLQPWCRWITPIINGVMRKRFDTRFFLAPVPAGQQPKHDNHEAVESVWFTPRQGLELYRDGEVFFAPPQLMSLAHLSRHATVASAMDEARQRPPPLILPEAFDEDGTRVMCYPGDERHSVRERAMPGPTRLFMRDERYFPADGFEGLF